MIELLFNDTVQWIIIIAVYIKIAYPWDKL